MFCKGTVSDWSLLTAVLGMEGGTDGISLPEFAVAEIGVAFRFINHTSFSLPCVESTAIIGQ